MLGVKRWPIQSALIRIMDGSILQDLVSGFNPSHTIIYLCYRGFNCIFFIIHFMFNDFDVYSLILMYF